MKWPGTPQTPLLEGKLIKRYKRFLADIELEDGDVITAHCANPGAMTGLKDSGLTAYLSKSDNPKRKLAYSLELLEVDGGLVGINTAHPNRIVEEALRTGQIPDLEAYKSVRREVKYGQNSRIDFLLEEEGLRDCYVEVKNVHFMRELGLAEFPDSVTTRGTKHLGELAKMVDLGHRAVMFYLVQRMDCTELAFAHDVDPVYADTLEKVTHEGVEILCWDCNITLDEITLNQPLKIR
jgi:sugar fermentation stimulation protein A